VLSYTVLKPSRLMFSRAPASALCGYSASAPTIAMVCGFGVCLAATSRNVAVQSTAGRGPAGMIWK